MGGHCDRDRKGLRRPTRTRVECHALNAWTRNGHQAAVTVGLVRAVGFGR